MSDANNAQQAPVSRRLETAVDWESWLKAVRTDASAIGCLGALDNRLQGAPRGHLAPRATERWNKFKTAVIASLGTTIAAWLDNTGYDVPAHDVGEIIVHLRDVGHWNELSRDIQEVEKAKVETLEFLGSGFTDVQAFVSHMRKLMQRLPSFYPEERAATHPVTERMNGHVLRQAKRAFPKQFSNTIALLEEHWRMANPQCTFTHMCESLQGKLTSLFAEGRAKQSEQGLVFVTLEGDEGHRAPAANDGDEANGVFITAKALENKIKKAKQAAKKEVYKTFAKGGGKNTSNSHHGGQGYGSHRKGHNNYNNQNYNNHRGHPYKKHDGHNNHNNGQKSKGKGKGVVECFRCGKLGHKAHECWSAAPAAKGKGKGQQGWF